MKRDTILNNGDLIVVDPRLCCSGDREINLRVVSVQKRYGIQSRSDQYINHLVKGVDVETGKVGWYDFGLIVRIMERAPTIGKLPENIFRGYQSWESITQTNATRTGLLYDLIKTALGRIPVVIDRPLHEERCLELFRKQMFVKEWIGGFWCVVRKKTFDGWVRRNHSLLIKTESELHTEGTEMLLQSDAVIRADMESFDLSNADIS